MRFIGNILWFIFGGLIVGTMWLLAGILWCVTIVGIPWGLQCFKFSALMYAPFGKEIVYGGGAGSFILNIIWLIISGLPMALGILMSGIVACITIVGIPVGLQLFKYSKLALMPFGAHVVS